MYIEINSNLNIKNESHQTKLRIRTLFSTFYYDTDILF
jgi:hypothetical protein